MVLVSQCYVVIVFLIYTVQTFPIDVYIVPTNCIFYLISKQKFGVKWT